MFLRLKRLTGATGAEGSALIAVVGVMAVGILVVVLVATSITAAFTSSSVSRAGIEAQAAADGGLSVAVAGLQHSGNCEALSGVYESAGNPAYRATVWRTSNSITWVHGCPLTTTTQVRIISTGSAQVGGLGNSSSGDRRFVEATYAYGQSSPGEQSPGSSVYSFAGGAFDKYHVFSPTGEGSDVSIRTGDFECTGPSLIEGGVRVAQGSANLTNTCLVKGSVYASRTVAMTTQSRVYGDVISSSGGVSLSNSTAIVDGSIYANGSATIHGVVGGSISATGVVSIVNGSSVGADIAAGSTVTLSSTVGGSVTTPGDLTFNGTGRVGGNIRIGGTLKYGKLTNATAAAALKTAGFVTGTIAYQQTGIATPTPQAAPIVADWVNVAYNYADWQAAGFPTELLWPVALGCRLGDSSSTSPSGSLYPFYQQLKDLSTPTVVDARGCSAVSGNVSLQLHTDVVFFGTSFDFDSLNISSADGNVHHIWFVVPDAQPTVAGPQCTKKGGDFTINTTSKIGANVVAMAYAPCTISINNGTVWQGQLYSGSMSGGGGIRELHYTPLGIPGTTVGGGSSGSAVYSLGSLISQRNRSDGGE